jgi:hypothetical protein
MSLAAAPIYISNPLEHAKPAASKVPLGQGGQFARLLGPGQPGPPPPAKASSNNFVPLNFGHFAAPGRHCARWAVKQTATGGRPVQQPSKWPPGQTATKLTNSQPNGRRCRELPGRAIGGPKNQQRQSRAANAAKFYVA